MRLDRFPARALAAFFLISTTLGCAANDLSLDAVPEDILTRAEEKLAKRKYLDAAEILEFFLRTHPGTAQTPLVKLRLGDARFGLEEYVLARGEYEDVVDDYPGSPYVEEARYQIARCSYASIYPHNLDQTETGRAIGLLEDFRRDYPASRFLSEVEEAIADCLSRLARGDFEAGRFYHKQGRLRSAKIQYEFIVRNYPETSWACRARYELGRIYRAKERFEEARSWFQRALDNCPAAEEAPLAEQAISEIRTEEGAIP